LRLKAGGAVLPPAAPAASFLSATIFCIKATCTLVSISNCCRAASAWACWAS
jgi:hypothetical protein